tara:strand:+ start:6764 stop:7042 length:279 start_codon:yes stop_codon:yes gene_type:complete
MRKRLDATITGKVQNVLFRDFVCRKARSLNILGTVENLKDRSVKVIAEGHEEDLQKLIPHLYKGPFMARVRDVNVEWSEAKGNLSNFMTIYS